MSIPLALVTGRILNADGNIARGEVIFAPLGAPILDEETPAALVGSRPIRTTLDDNGALTLALAPGAYDVSFRLVGSSRPGFTVTLTEEHTAEAPLDLGLAAPVIASPAVKFVVNELVYRDALAARDAAIAAHTAADAARTATVAARDGARAAADEALAARDAASTSATTASSSAAQTAEDRAAIESLLPEFAWTLDPDDSDVVLFRVPEHWIDTNDELIINMPVLGR